MTRLRKLARAYGFALMGLALDRSPHPDEPYTRSSRLWSIGEALYEWGNYRR